MQLPQDIKAIRVGFQVPASPGKVLDRFVYCFIIAAKKVTLVDTGVSSTEKVIAEHLAASGRDITEVEDIILTHAHPDHIGAARAIQRASGCRVHIHAAERHWAEDPDLQDRQRPVPGFRDLVGGPVQIDSELVDGMAKDLGDGRTMKVIHTPGHSPGSCSFWFEGVLFSGDSIPLPDDMPIYDDFMVSLASLQELLAVKDARALCMSWAEPNDHAGACIRRGLEWMRRVDGAVHRANAETGKDEAAMTRRVLDDIGLRDVPALPLITRSLRSHDKSKG